MLEDVLKEQIEEVKQHISCALNRITAMSGHYYVAHVHNQQDIRASYSAVIHFALANLYYQKASNIQHTY